MIKHKTLGALHVISYIHASIVACRKGVAKGEATRIGDDATALRTDQQSSVAISHIAEVGAM